MHDAPVAIAQLIALAGITPNEEETQAMVDALPVNRASVDALYAVPGVRYEVPCLTWSAVP